ncbi:hypothetical protein [Clostridium sp. CTA-6]
MSKDRIKALKEFMLLNRHNLNKPVMKDLYYNIFDYKYRYALAHPLDIYVDIKWFIDEGIKEINGGNNEAWYFEDFKEAGLI